MTRPDQHTLNPEQRRLAQVRAGRLRESGRLLVCTSQQRFEQTGARARCKPRVLGMTAPWAVSQGHNAVIPPRSQVTRATGPVTAPALRLIGELDLAAAPLLAAAAAALTGEGDPVRGLAVQVDVSELVFLDSAGLHALNDVTVQLRRAGAIGVTLTQTTRPVLRLLTLAADAGWIDPASEARSSPPDPPCGRRRFVTEARWVTV